ncbi:MAG: hypothetical protein ACXWRA_15910, partial [Pseudobdellovibrionaceae bacterium]
AEAIRCGLKIALISGDSSEAGMKLVQRYAEKLRILDVYKGCRDKRAAVVRKSAATTTIIRRFRSDLTSLAPS